MADIFATAVYILCFLTSAACAWLLGRSYLANRTPLLLWSGICFACVITGPSRRSRGS